MESAKDGYLLCAPLHEYLIYLCPLKTKTQIVSLVLLLHLNQNLMLFYWYVLCLSYHSNTSCSVCMSFLRLGHHNSRLPGPKVGNSIRKCLSQEHSDMLPHQESNQDFETFHY